MVSFFAVPRFVGVTEIGALGELWEFLNFCAAEIGSDRGVKGGGSSGRWQKVAHDQPAASLPAFFSAGWNRCQVLSTSYKCARSR